MNPSQNQPWPLGGRTSQNGVSVKLPFSKTAIPAAQMLTRDGLAVSKSMLVMVMLFGPGFFSCCESVVWRVRPNAFLLPGRGRSRSYFFRLRFFRAHHHMGRADPESAECNHPSPRPSENPF